ncbi:HNH endonuclease family protein [Acidocella sp. C78]|uniref:HNH endonuclease family protein n=1 Tax=Acidocella sp. C78 TaxID=1671486 RepID=UPI00191B920B|nr:HNH endonuclease family protein [Acidocella sp. C78]
MQERFLRQLYNMFKYLKQVEVKGCPRATRSNLITIYDTLLRKRPVWLFGSLQAKGKIYATLMDTTAAKVQWGELCASALQDLQRLGAAPAYAFLLWASQVAQSQAWDEGDTLRRLATLLTKWFFWRNLTDMPPTRELDPMFMELVGDLLKLIRSREVRDLDAFVQRTSVWLLQRAAPEDDCDSRLKGDVYLENYEVTRFMLCKLEEAHQTLESRRDLWAHDANERPVFTVEHILPKTENLGPGWVAMLEGDGSVTADAIRQRCAHQLGNLTLSGYNSKLGTMEFLRKRDRQNDKGDFIGYRNGLYLNADLASRNDWNEPAIAARTEKMRREVKSILGLREDS